MDDPTFSPIRWNRRTLLGAAGGTALAAVLPPMAEATPEEADAAIREMFGDKPINEGRVWVKLPPIAENGNSVAIDITVDSPMSDDDHVRRIGIFSPRNPIATIAEFRLGPHAGRAQVSTRVRLAGTQTLRVIAEMSDGTLWAGKATTYVTLAACVIG
ncbi:MAG: sulfur oxidation protein SoxY [Rhodobiaceae bacterium]|nr:thiosulfate oxidation carrier protein SoxY [Hyphomonas sp.]MCB9961616.1 sulfur oxidation protein SoxY [Hyphomonas sp.]MCB9971173.1 sulfur oxidation protein SoxY [Hyphomonas sp.]MCC0050242.1 sulfur oxidation protein SoxY [Rhodobiaceae bacterium]